jgi:NADPH:quinone reductase
MRAVAYDVNGPADQVLSIREVPEPTPSDGEVRVQIHYSAVNPTDVKRRSVEKPQFGEFQVPHHDGSGVIDQIGHGVSVELLGQRVWVYHGAHNRKLGTAAEFICLTQDQVIPIPDEISLLTAALVGIPMMTAAHALSSCQNLEGKNVLISGGAGAVGSAAISLAKYRGPHVIATVSSTEKALVAEQAGADVIINHQVENMGAVLESQGSKIDLVIDVAIGTYLPSYLPHLANNARIVSYSSDGPELTTSVRPLMFVNAGIDFFVVFNLNQSEIQQAVSTVCQALSDGVYPMLPVRTFSLDDCAAAHKYVEDRSLGRAVLQISE